MGFIKGIKGEYMSVKGRLKLLAGKLLSFKFVCLLIASLLLVGGYLNDRDFTMIFCTVVFGREGAKFLNNRKQS